MTNLYGLHNLTPFARERLTVTTTPTQLTASVYNDESAVFGQVRRATAALIQPISDEQIFYTIEGSTPSAAVGLVARGPDSVGAKNAELIVLNSQQEIADFQAVHATTTCDIEIVYFR